MTPERESRADRIFMRRALALARRGLGRTAPNPMVGAVVVRDGRVVGEGYHAEYGGPHAEIVALRAAGDAAAGATLYVTLEPCNHTGKTPPCIDAVLASRVRRVVVAIRDPNPVAAGGISRLERAGIDVTVGVEEARARELLAHFLAGFSLDRPFVTLKLALSIDAAIADASGGSRWITGSRARHRVHALRAAHDAIAVGIGTVLADDPQLTVRGRTPPRVPPRRIVFDRMARLPLGSQLVRTAAGVPTIVVVGDAPVERVQGLEDAGVAVVRADSLADALVRLRAQGLRSLLVEGGARLAGAFLSAAVVDRLIIFQAPLILGAGALGAFAYASPASLAGVDRWRVVERRRLGEDLMTVYALREVACSPGS